MTTKKQQVFKKTKSQGDFTQNILWSGLLIISSLFLVIFALNIKTNINEILVKNSLANASSKISKAVSQKLSQLDTSAREIIQDNQGNENIVELLLKSLANTKRVLRVSEPVKTILPDPVFPGINFATLDMIKNTSNTQQEQLPEIHLYGQKDQYLNFVYIQEPSETYLVISYPVESIFDNTLSHNIENGVITLTQKSGKWSNIVLKSWGGVANSKNFYGKDQPIANSHFYISNYYIKPQLPFMQVSMFNSIISFLAALALCILVFLKRKKLLEEIELKAQVQQEPVYVPRVRKSGDTNEVQKLKDTTGNKLISSETEKPTSIPDKSIFKAYDIRGIVDETLTINTVTQIGHAIGTENLNRGCKNIVVARDGRLSGPSYLKALITGLQKSGCDVINIGAVPTGVLYFATHHLETGSGVMLTGSHNPPNYNGLKIMLNGETLAGKLITNLYNMIAAGDLFSGEGSVQELDITDDYIDYISSDIQLENEPTIVVDCGNGIPGNIAPELLEEIGCNVIPLHCEVDGNFPNHHPDPSVPENLQDLISTVKSVDADLGIAFDGDGDRLGVVTKKGEIIYPDRLLMLFAKDVLVRQPGSSIIFDVKCTGHLPKYIVKSGGMPIMWKTGHSFMKAKLKETKASLAGEMSGHFFFNERWFGFDDGIYAAARLLEILDQEERDPQEVFDELPKGVSTPELKVNMDEGEHYKYMEKFQNKASFPDAKITTIDGIRADFTDGWGLVRCSNTTPCLVMRFDADDLEALKRIKEEFRVQLLAIDAALDLPF